MPVAELTSYRPYNMSRANCVTFCMPGCHMRIIRGQRQTYVSAIMAEFVAISRDFTYRGILPPVGIQAH